MSELNVWKVEYEGSYSHKVTGFPVTQDVAEYLIATEHALVKFKVCKPKSGGKTRVFTDLQTVRRDFMHDLGALKRHDFYRRMWRSAGNSPLKVPEMLGVHDFKTLLHDTGLEDLIKGDEKAQNALMTAMGHHGELMLPEVVERARAETVAQRQRALVEAAKAKVAGDELWGIF